MWGKKSGPAPTVPRPEAVKAMDLDTEPAGPEPQRIRADLFTDGDRQVAAMAYMTFRNAQEEAAAETDPLIADLLGKIAEQVRHRGAETLLEINQQRTQEHVEDTIEGDAHAGS
jgi:hypothetical protein